MIVLDEFGANLDRTLAKVLAFNLRKLVTRLGIGALCATTHEDLTSDLEPDTWVRCLGDGQVEVEQRQAKKNGSALATISGFPSVPVPTGRTSLGGITAPTTSPTPAA